MIKKINDLPVKGKRVLVRVDFNVPLTQVGKVRDDTRIRAALPTIKYIADSGGRVILMSHLGRPKGNRTAEFSLRPCADRLSDLLGKSVGFVDDCIGEKPKQAIAQMKDGDVVLLENLRFHPEEEKPTEEFVQQLADLGDLYVNDAFGTAHRAHASTTLIARHFPDKCAAGMLLMQEIDALGKHLLDPTPPFVAIIGGAKVSSKLGILSALLNKVDSLLIGGAMAFTFMLAVGMRVGNSLVEEEMVDDAREILQQAKSAGKRILFPCDFVIASEVKEGANYATIEIESGIPGEMIGVDIGPKTLAEWQPVISRAKTIFWNGPMGVFEIPAFASGTRGVAEMVAGCRSAFSVIGGGDSIAAVEQTGVQSAISHISTGGGASLEFIEHGTLPGIQALEEK